jgi:hypothetical protein
MKRTILMYLSLWFCVLNHGCKSPAPDNGNYTPSVNLSEIRAKESAAWVKKNAGLIQVAVQATTQIAIFSSESDSDARAETTQAIHTVVENLNTLITNGTIDPASVREALSVKEEYVDGILRGIGTIYASKYTEIMENGYAEFSIELLKAVSRGMADGTVQ